MTNQVQDILTQNPESRAQNPEPRTQNPEPGTQNPKPRTQIPNSKFQNSKLKTQNPKPGTRNSELRTQNSCWYALYTKPRFEKKVEAVLAEAGYEVYLPLISTVRQWSDRKKKLRVPLINSYVFVNIKEKKLNTLLQYNGVVRILKYLGKPAVIKDYEMDNLKIICQSPDLIDTQYDTADFTKGESMQITKGPLIGLFGTYVQRQGKHRLIIQVSSLGLEVAVQIPVSYIERLKAS